MFRDSEEADDGDKEQENSTREAGGNGRQNSNVCNCLRVYGYCYQR